MLMCGKEEMPTCVFACDRGALFFDDLRAQNNQKRRAKLRRYPKK